MAYQFSGIFSDANTEHHGELVRITSGQLRQLSQSASIVAIALCGEREFDVAPWNPLEFPLLDWSRDHPEVTLIYAYIQCHGGNCDQAGFVCRGGRVIHVEPMEEDYPKTDTPLTRLLGYLDIDLDNGYFEPLTRDFFSIDEGT